jgi:hypothetical protein
MAKKTKPATEAVEKPTAAAVEANEQLAERLSGAEKYYLMESKKELVTVVESIQESFRDKEFAENPRYKSSLDECNELAEQFDETEKIAECRHIVGRMVSHLNECLTHYNSTL